MIVIFLSLHRQEKGNGKDGVISRTLLDRYVFVLHGRPIYLRSAIPTHRRRFMAARCIADPASVFQSHFAASVSDDA